MTKWQNDIDNNPYGHRLTAWHRATLTRVNQLATGYLISAATEASCYAISHLTGVHLHGIKVELNRTLQSGQISLSNTSA